MNFAAASEQTISRPQRIRITQAPRTAVASEQTEPCRAPQAAASPAAPPARRSRIRRMASVSRSMTSTCCCFGVPSLPVCSTERPRRQPARLIKKIAALNPRRIAFDRLPDGRWSAQLRVDQHVSDQCDELGLAAVDLASEGAPQRWLRYGLPSSRVDDRQTDLVLGHAEPSHNLDGVALFGGRRKHRAPASPRFSRHLRPPASRNTSRRCLFEQ